jgi:hypothetical protein
MSKSFDVPQNVRKEAERGLKLRKEHGRGGLSTQEAGAHGIGSGVQRASDLVQGRVSFKTVKRMLAFFNRHKGYKKHHTTNPPSNSLISWLLWGGDSGFAWAKRIVEREMSKNMYTFNELVWFAKAQGHKYIKRIPVGTTASGRTRYRYIYSTTSTVGGKHLLDEAHLKVGTKLMLHSKSGEEVHAHIESVDGNYVTIKYDDGEEKGRTRTVSKQDLLQEFDKEHGVDKDLKEAHESAKQDLKTAKESGATDKQLKRIQDRIDKTRVGQDLGEKSAKLGKIDKVANKLLDAYDTAYKSVLTNESDEVKTRKLQALIDANDKLHEVLKDKPKLDSKGIGAVENQRKELDKLRDKLFQHPFIRNHLMSLSTEQASNFVNYLLQPIRGLWGHLDETTKLLDEESKKQVKKDKEASEVLRIIEDGYDVKSLPDSKVESELARLKDLRELSNKKLQNKYTGGISYRLEHTSGKFSDAINALESRAKRLKGDVSPDFMRTLKRGDTFNIKGKAYKVRSKTTRRVDGFLKITFEPADGKGDVRMYGLTRNNMGAWL